MQNSKTNINNPFFFNQLNRFKINQNKQAFLEKDAKLNRLLVDTVAFSVVGYLTGTAFSMFFKKRMIPQNIGFGMGLGFALHYNGQILLNKNWQSQRFIANELELLSNIEEKQ